MSMGEQDKDYGGRDTNKAKGMVREVWSGCTSLYIASKGGDHM